jgi:hypothetical protein
MQSGKRLASSRGQKKHDLKIVLFFCLAARTVLTGNSNPCTVVLFLTGRRRSPHFSLF